MIKLPSSGIRDMMSETKKKRKKVETAVKRVYQEDRYKGNDR